MLNVMKVAFAALLMVSLQVQAAALTALQLEDQWEKPQAVDSSLKWVVLGQSKDNGNWVKATFNKHKVTDPKSLDMVYVADISAMPGLITKLFALPKMRDYSFPIALVTEEEMIAAWPKEEDTLMVYQVSGLEIVEQTSVMSEEDFMKLFESKIMK